MLAWGEVTLKLSLQGFEKGSAGLCCHDVGAKMGYAMLETRLNFGNVPIHIDSNLSYK